MTTEQEIQRADPAARARALRRLLPLGIVGLSLAALLTAFAGPLADRVPATLILGLLLVLILIAAVVSWPIRRLWRSGQTAATAARFPPPALPVVHDTPVCRGAAAVLRGRILQAFAITLAAFVWITALAVVGLLLTVVWAASA
jgi:hypothetical protein